MARRRYGTKEQIFGTGALKRAGDNLKSGKCTFCGGELKTRKEKAAAACGSCGSRFAVRMRR